MEGPWPWKRKAGTQTRMGLMEAWKHGSNVRNGLCGSMDAWKRASIEDSCKFIHIVPSTIYDMVYNLCQILITPPTNNLRCDSSASSSIFKYCPWKLNIDVSGLKICSMAKRRIYLLTTLNTFLVGSAA